MLSIFVGAVRHSNTLCKQELIGSILYSTVADNRVSGAFILIQTKGETQGSICVKVKGDKQNGYVRRSVRKVLFFSPQDNQLINGKQVVHLQLRNVSNLFQVRH